MGNNDRSLSRILFGLKLCFTITYYCGCSPFKLKKSNDTGRLVLCSDSWFQKIFYYVLSFHMVYGAVIYLMGEITVMPDTSVGLMKFSMFIMTIIGLFAHILRLCTYHYIFHWKRRSIQRIISIIEDLHFIKDEGGPLPGRGRFKFVPGVVVLYTIMHFFMAFTSLSYHITNQNFFPTSSDMGTMADRMYSGIIRTYPFLRVQDEFNASAPGSPDIFANSHDFDLGSIGMSYFQRFFAITLYIVTSPPSLVYSDNSVEFLQDIFVFTGLVIMHEMNKYFWKSGLGKGPSHVENSLGLYRSEFLLRSITEKKNRFEVHLEDYHRIKIIIECLNDILGFLYLQWITLALPVYVFYTSSYLFNQEMLKLLFTLEWGLLVMYYYTSVIIGLLLPSLIHQQAQDTYRWFLCEDQEDNGLLVEDKHPTKAIILMNVDRQMDLLSLKLGNTFTISFGFFTTIIGVGVTYTVVSIQFLSSS